MALTPAEKKKMLKIEKDLASKQKALETLKEKAAKDFAKLAIKYQLYRLDKAVVITELKTIAEKHKL